MIAKTDVRLICRLMIAMCLGCPAAVAFQQAETPAPANPTAQTSAPVPSQTEPRPTQDQSQVQKTDSAKPETETKTQPQTKPARTQRSANRATPGARHHAAPNRAAAPTPPGAPKKVVVRQGGAAEPTAQIVTGMTPEEADRQRREAELLLSTTDERLKEIAPRPLDSRQQETVSQIHNYMEGSCSALKQGDVSRAHTLAQKADLLVDDLARH